MVNGKCVTHLLGMDAMTNKLIPLSIPHLAGKEWAYIKDCLDSGWVSSVGPYVDRFEQETAKLLERKHAIACVNGTSAIHTALMIAGVNNNDEVIMPSLTFIAPANATRYIGAWPVFMDVDDKYWQMDIDKLKTFLEKECTYTAKGLINRRTKRIIKVILPVHILGHSVDMDPLMRLARKYGLMVIEDVAESMGALYKGKKVGSMADIACLSFNGNKIITTGGGGMLLTNNSVLAKRAKYLTTQAKDNPIEYIHNEIGYNYRLSNIQAALGVAQLEHLNKFVGIKKTIASVYEVRLKYVDGIRLPQQAPWSESIWWLYTVCIDPKKYGMSSRQLLQCLESHGIQSRPLWCPLHLLIPFKNAHQYALTVVEQLYKQALSLPSSVQMTKKQQEQVIKAIESRGK